MQGFEGIVVTENNFLFCSVELVGSKQLINIPFDLRNKCIPGDRVLVAVKQVKYWKLSLDDDEDDVMPLEYYVQYLSRRLKNLVSNNFESINSNEELIELILCHKQMEKPLNPICEVVIIEEYQKLENITGTIDSGYFWPDAHYLYPFECEESLEYTRVIGDVDRENSKFLFKRNITGDMRGLTEDQSQGIFSGNPIQGENAKRNAVKSSIEKIKAYNEKETVDLTDLLTITIDTENAKMLDDAIHFRIIDKDTVELGIHCNYYFCEIEPTSETIKTVMRKFHRKVAYRVLGKTKTRECQLELDRTYKTFSMIFVFNLRTKEIISMSAGPTKIKIKAQFTFSSFDETMFFGERKETRISKSVDRGKLVENIMQLTSFVNENFNYTDCDSNTNGEVVIKKSGKFFARMLGFKLMEKYEDLAIVKKSKSCVEAYFRSPLRKPRDVFVLRQLFSCLIGLDRYEMAFFVCGGDEAVLKNLFNIW